MGPAPLAAPNAINVLVADSNRMQSQLLGTTLRRRSEFRVTTCDLDTGSILHAVSLKVPTVTLFCLNAHVNLSDTVTTLRRFHLSHPAIPKVLVTDMLDRELVISAFRSGARGVFSLNDSNVRLLFKCLQRVAEGQVWANSAQLSYLLDLVSEVPSLRVLNSKGVKLLTPREEQVVALVAEGLGNRQIAVELNLSEHTIKKYLFKVFEKLGISTRVELVLYAVNNGAPRSAEWLAGATRLPVT